MNAKDARAAIIFFIHHFMLIAFNINLRGAGIFS